MHSNSDVISWIDAEIAPVMRLAITISIRINLTVYKATCTVYTHKFRLHKKHCTYPSHTNCEILCCMLCNVQCCIYIAVCEQTKVKSNTKNNAIFDVKCLTETRTREYSFLNSFFDVINILSNLHRLCHSWWASESCWTFNSVLLLLSSEVQS